MSTCNFRSPLAARLQSFYELRRSVGRKGKREMGMLIDIDGFLLVELRPGGAITRDVVDKWVSGMAHLSAGTRINKLSTMRQLCSYLAHFDPRTCIVYRSFFPDRTRVAPHIYSRQEVRSIMEAAMEIGPPGSLRPDTVATMIGLLYSTGIRIGEALKLTLGDVDLKRRLLLIRETKFGKTRYVPLSATTVRNMRHYIRKRKRKGFSQSPGSPVFATQSGRAHGEARIYTVFIEIMRRLGLRGPKGQRGPRIHDFRHTFAVNRLLAWYRGGENVQAKLPLLSTYLGHTTVTATEVYLHATAELLEAVGKRFHDHFLVPPVSRKGGRNEKG